MTGSTSGDPQRSQPQQSKGNLEEETTLNPAVLPTDELVYCKLKIEDERNACWSAQAPDKYGTLSSHTMWGWIMIDLAHDKSSVQKDDQANA